MKKSYKRIINMILALTILITVTSSNSFQSLAAPTKSTKQTITDTMEVHYIDVGQGDSTLIKCGEHFMLIDAGDDSKGTLIQSY